MKTKIIFVFYFFCNSIFAQQIIFEYSQKINRPSDDLNLKYQLIMEDDKSLAKVKDIKDITQIENYTEFDFGGINDSVVSYVYKNQDFPRFVRISEEKIFKSYSENQIFVSTPDNFKENHKVIKDSLDIFKWEFLEDVNDTIILNFHCKKAKTEILKNHPKIDTIINNAGIGYRSFVELSEDKKIDSIVNVNWLGVVKVCRAFIPTLREQKFGQIINITSVAGLVNLPLGNFYHSTKQAVESFSECMAYELYPFNISVSTVQFGNAPTDFQKNVTKSEQTNIASYNKLMDKISQLLLKKSGKNANLPQQIVEKLYHIASHPNRNFRRYTIGFDANFMKILRRVTGYRIFNLIIRKNTIE